MTLPQWGHGEAFWPFLRCCCCSGLYLRWDVTEEMNCHCPGYTEDKKLGRANSITVTSWEYPNIIFPHQVFRLLLQYMSSGQTHPERSLHSTSYHSALSIGGSRFYLRSFRSHTCLQMIVLFCNSNVSTTLRSDFFFFYEVTWKKREVLWYLLNVFYGRSLRSVCVSFKLQNSPVKRGLHYLGFTNTEMESHRGLVNFFLPDNIFKNSLKMWQERVTTMLLKSTDTVAEYVLIQSICWETRNGRNSCMIGSQWDCCLKKSKPEGSMVFQNAQRWELLQN